MLFQSSRAGRCMLSSADSERCADSRQVGAGRTILSKLNYVICMIVGSRSTTSDTAYDFTAFVRFHLLTLRDVAVFAPVWQLLHQAHRGDMSAVN